MRPIVDAGVDVIYLDESHTPTGEFVVDGVTAIQGVMALQDEIVEAFPGVALYVEQLNPMNARRASFALNSLDPGHPLGGYLFRRFVKFTGFGRFHEPVDESSMDALQSWGFQIPAATQDESWLRIARAFQRFRLDPAPRLPLNPQQLSAYSGPGSVVAYYEKHPHRRGLVVHEPGRPEQWFGARVTGVRSWPGPGALRDWPVYDGNTLLALDPKRTYVFDENEPLPEDRFHLNRVPDDFQLHSHTVGQDGSYFRLVFSGRGQVGLTIPDDRCLVFLNGREVPVDRNQETTRVPIDFPPDRPATMLAFLRSGTELAGRWIDLPWQTGDRPPRQGTGYVSLNQAEGFFNHVGGKGLLIGRLPKGGRLRLQGEYGMRPVSKSVGDGVVRINGREVLRVPAGPRPFSRHSFDVDISAASGRDVLLEFSSEGQIVGFGAGDWYGPRIAVGE